MQRIEMPEAISEAAMQVVAGITKILNSIATEQEFIMISNHIARNEALLHTRTPLLSES